MIFLLGRFFFFAGLALPMVTLPAMISDAVDYGEWKSEIRNEVLLFGSETMGMKFDKGVGAK